MQDGADHMEPAEGNSQADLTGDTDQREVLIRPRREMQINEEV